MFIFFCKININIIHILIFKIQLQVERNKICIIWFLPEKRAKEIFLQKKFLLLSEKTPRAGLLREQTKNFLQKFFVCSLFGFKIILRKFSFVQPVKMLTLGMKKCVYFKKKRIFFKKLFKRFFLNNYLILLRIRIKQKKMYKHDS
jgi:hypothetical protein